MTKREEVAAELGRKYIGCPEVTDIDLQWRAREIWDALVDAKVELAEREQPAIAPQTPADAREKELREALDKYGIHAHDCGRWQCWHSEHTVECCTCGFDRARAVLSEGSK